MTTNPPSTNKGAVLEKGPLNYLDAIFGLLNFAIIVIPLILIQSNIVLPIIGVICALILLIQGIRKFNKGEMTYANYGMALMVVSWLYLIPLVILVNFLVFFAVFELAYVIIIVVKRRPLSASTFHYRTTRRGVQPYYTSSAKSLKRDIQAEQVENQSNVRKHLYLSILLAIILLVVFLIWFDPHLALNITIQE